MERPASQTAAEPAAQPSQYLTFVLAERTYGVGLANVLEILEHEPATRVPSTPSWIRGVINLRGNVTPVVDLSVKFGREASPVTRRTCVVILNVELEGLATLVGILADAVEDVLELPAESVEPAPAFGLPVRPEYLLGMAKVAGQFVLLLDIDRVLSASELLGPGSLEESLALGGGSAGRRVDGSSAEQSSRAPAVPVRRRKGQGSSPREGGGAR